MKLWQRRLLGILALGGGATGISVTGQHVFQQTQFLHWVFCLVAIAIYAWGIWCGVIMLESRPDAAKYNQRYWLVQTPIFMSPIIGGNIWGGVHFSLTLEIWPINVGFFTAFGSGFNYSMMDTSKPFIIGVNVVALAIAAWLTRQTDEITAS